MGHRHKAREYALQALYMYETVKASPEELESLNWLNKEIPDDIREYAVSIINGSIEKIDFIDDLIKKYSKNWQFERLGLIDKSILRLSIYSLLFAPDIPSPVVINEGVELGKTFGGENSGQFINGILDSIKNKELNKGENSAGERQPKK
ncbi:MAG: transcription antitermination factor NusB [Spirochaetes bacterium]|nr:transcription antitermination factor NusB [Spirochaetota bacterium]